jgi:Xaa-Pro dipeptidase
MSTLRELAQRNRQSLLTKLTNCTGIVYLKSGVLQDRKWTDTEHLFRQESNFFYATGCHLPGFHFVIDLATKSTVLFSPDYPKDYELWCGPPKTTSQIRQEYGVDECVEESKLIPFLKKYKEIHVLDQGELVGFPVNSTVLKEAIAESRIRKNDSELRLMQKACDISCEAHIALMKAIKPGQGTEWKYASLFEYESRLRGGKFQAYNAIVGGGLNPAVLHHYTNDEPFPTDPNAFVLVDAGCEYHCYASDITRTFPIGGVFRDEYKTIYEIVLESNQTVIDSLKPGVEWEDMHRLASLVILRGLVKAGILVGDEEELVKNHVAALFLPHGLGHSLGIDVHDAGGYPFGVERIDEPGIRYLRMRRKLEEGMVVTVEPGIYFVNVLLDNALQDPDMSRFLNADVLKRYRKVGGVRIEDDVLITSTGTLVLTDKVPKTIPEIELIMKSK